MYTSVSDIVFAKLFCDLCQVFLPYAKLKYVQIKILLIFRKRKSGFQAINKTNKLLVSLLVECIHLQSNLSYYFLRPFCLSELLPFLPMCLSALSPFCKTFTNMKSDEILAVKNWAQKVGFQNFPWDRSHKSLLKWDGQQTTLLTQAQKFKCYALFSLIFQRGRYPIFVFTKHESTDVWNCSLSISICEQWRLLERFSEDFAEVLAPLACCIE